MGGIDGEGEKKMSRLTYIVHSLAQLELTVAIAHMVRKMDIVTAEGFREDVELVWRDTFNPVLENHTRIYITERKV